MDNAATALLMAGGVLIAIIVISLFVLSYNNMTSLAQAEVDAALQEEVDEFNAPFLAFNKTAMYGTDIVSILNYAISNNKLYDVSTGEEYYIDISFTLTETIADSVMLYELQSNGTYKTTQQTVTNNTLYGALAITFEAGTTYKLSNSDHLDAIEDFLQRANDSSEKKTILETNDAVVTKYTITKSGMATFKRQTFKCSNVEYDSNGRVILMEFKQI